jgi:hypothetical protein
MHAWMLMKSQVTISVCKMISLYVGRETAALHVVEAC